MWMSTRGSLLLFKFLMKMKKGVIKKRLKRIDKLFVK